MSYTKEDEDREIKEFIKKNKNVRYVGIVGVDIPDISRFLIPDLITKKKKIEVERQIKVIPWNKSQGQDWGVYLTTAKKIFQNLQNLWMTMSMKVSFIKFK